MKAICIVLLLASVASAQSTFIDEDDYGLDNIPSPRCLQSYYRPSWGIVQVAARKSTGVELATALAVGNHSDGRRLFLTAAHCVDGADCVELYGEGLNSRAQVLATDSRQDVALLAAPIPNGHPMENWTLAQETIPEDEDIPMGGFVPESEQYKQVEPTFTQLGSTRMWAKARLRNGMSGGPIYSPRTKQLLGMVVASGRTKSWALGVNVQFLRGFMVANLDKRSLASVKSAAPMKLPSNWSTMQRCVVDYSQWSPVSYRIRTLRMPGPPRWLRRR